MPIAQPRLRQRKPLDAGPFAPKVHEKLVPVFTSEELPRWRRRARASRSASGATPRSSPCSPRPGSVRRSWPGSVTTSTTPRRSDVDLGAREITVRGKGGKPRVVRISHEAARLLDRYLRVRSRHGPGLAA